MASMSRVAALLLPLVLPLAPQIAAIEDSPMVETAAERDGDCFSVLQVLAKSTYFAEEAVEPPKGNAAGLAQGSSGVTGILGKWPTARRLSRDEAVRLLARAHSRNLYGLNLSEPDPGDPIEQVHLGLAGEGEAVVSFATRKRRHPSVVHYGKPDEGLTHKASGEGMTYTKYRCPGKLSKLRLSTDGKSFAVSDADLAKVVNSSRLGLPTDSGSYTFIDTASEAWDHLRGNCVDYRNPLAFFDSPYLHTVVLTGLEPRTTYSYRPEGASRTFTFTMPPRAGDAVPERPLKFAVWADVGTTNISLNAMLQISRSQADVVLTVGDYSYADGWDPIWDTFGVMLEPMMSSIAGLGVVGNHEIQKGFEQGVDFTHRFPQPYRQSGSTSPLMYSYETGLVHVLALPGGYAPSWNLTSKEEPASEQYLFAAEDLAALDRSRTPWVVVMFHAPWYSSNEKAFNEGIKHQWDMEELFRDHGVDVVFNGHVHSYERSLPVYKDEPDPCGTVYIVVGDAGNSGGPSLQWRQPQPAWSAFREASFGSGLLTVFNETCALWEWKRMACATKSLDQDVFLWEDELGLHGEACVTTGDTAATASASSDSAYLVRDVAACPNRGRPRAPTVQPVS